MTKITVGKPKADGIRSHFFTTNLRSDQGIPTADWLSNVNNNRNAAINVNNLLIFGRKNLLEA